MTTVQDVSSWLEDFAPARLAEAWDHVGLLLGDPAAAVGRLMTCLTVTPETTAEAVDRRAELIVSHHPILFHPVQRLDARSPEGRMLLALAASGVAVYSPHTAFDNTRGGINDQIAEAIGLGEVGPLRTRPAPARDKVVVFVPPADLERVQRAIFDAGAGVIGEYTECSFRLAGTGTFLGSAASNPTVGQRGRREEVAEWRLEVVCPHDRLAVVLAALRAAHSYEEPAYDVYPLGAGPDRLGIGRTGRLAEPLGLDRLARVVAAALGTPTVEVVGGGGRLIQRVAVVCGAGADFLDDAVRAGCDVLVTGEARFHQCLAAQAAGIGLILPGHYATERPAVEALARGLARQFPAIEVWASERERDPRRQVGP